MLPIYAVFAYVQGRKKPAKSAGLIEHRHYVT